MIKKVLFTILICLLPMVALSCKETENGYYSYVIQITDNQKEYTIKVKEYKDNKVHLRKDDWENEEKGNLSYITIKEDLLKENCFIIHNDKKAFKINGTENFIVNAPWLGELDLKLIQKEALPDETIEGYLCKKTLFKNETDTETCTVWYSEKLGFPLKVESSLTGYEYNLKITDINREEFDRNIFYIPEDYEKILIDPALIEELPLY